MRTLARHLRGWHSPLGLAARSCRTVTCRLGISLVLSITVTVTTAVSANSGSKDSEGVAVWVIITALTTMLFYVATTLLLQLLHSCVQPCTPWTSVKVAPASEHPGQLASASQATRQALLGTGETVGGAAGEGEKAGGVRARVSFSPRGAMPLAPVTEITEIPTITAEVTRSKTEAEILQAAWRRHTATREFMRALEQQRVDALAVCVHVLTPTSSPWTTLLKCSDYTQTLHTSQRV